MALDQRLKRILEGVGATVGNSVDKHYEEIERELIEKVAKPRGFIGRGAGQNSFSELWRHHGPVALSLALIFSPSARQ
jgi:hypothetical protein